MVSAVSEQFWVQFQSSFRAVLRAVLKQDVRAVPEQLIGTIEQFWSSFRCIFSSALLRAICEQRRWNFRGVSERDGASYPASSKVKLSSEFIAISTSFYSNFRAISISFQSNVRAMSEQCQSSFRPIAEQFQSNVRCQCHFDVILVSFCHDILVSF